MIVTSETVQGRRHGRMKQLNPYRPEARMQKWKESVSSSSQTMIGGHRIKCNTRPLGGVGCQSCDHAIAANLKG